MQALYPDAIAQSVKAAVHGNGVVGMSPGLATQRVW